jgi:hypothetical protein
MQDAKVCAGQFDGSRIAVFLEDAHSTKAGSFSTAGRKSLESEDLERERFEINSPSLRRAYYDPL